MIDFMSTSRVLCISAVAVATTLLTGEAVAQGVTDVTASEAVAESNAETPTYHGAAEAALTRNCVSCHRDGAPSIGGITAPMGLTSYQEARRWSGSIARVLKAGYMPPWGAHAQHEGVFKGDRYISDVDKQTLITWAEAGAPMGEQSESGPKVSVVDGRARYDCGLPGARPRVRGS